MRAAVFHEVGQPLTVEEIEVDAPGPREVLVDTAASGVCHSDFHLVEGLHDIAMMGGTPAILGHEGAGIVAAVGDAVTEFTPGDHVVGCSSVFCGNCNFCLVGQTYLCRSPVTRRRRSEPPRYTWNGARVTQFAGLATYAEQMLVHENSLVKIRDDMPLDKAALIGCAVTTGVGAALNTARVEPGSTVAVFGAGGIGLSAIQGARIAGARMIIAVDIFESKLSTAREFGATHSVDASTSDPVDAIRELTGGGADYTFEAIGLKTAVEQSFEAIRRGGLATIIGVMPQGQKVELNGVSFLQEKKIQGSSMGSNRFRIDIPRYIEFYRQGRLLLDEMVTRTGRLDDLNEAFRAMKAGEVARTVLLMN